VDALTTQDPSAAGPRTQLAWRRTALGFVVVALIELRTVGSCGPTALTLGVAVVALLTALALFGSSTSKRQLRPLLLTMTAVLAISTVLVHEVWAGC